VNQGAKVFLATLRFCSLFLSLPCLSFSAQRGIMLSRQRLFLMSALLVFVLMVGVTLKPAWAITTPPTISPSTGVYPNTSSVGSPVTITAGMGATIYYTTNGTTPTTSSTVYTAPFNITASTQVNAIAVISGVPSTVTTAYIDIDPNAAAIYRTNLIMWYTGDFGVSAPGGHVTQWADLSGNSNNATQVSPSKEPSLISGAINGYAAVGFNGTSSYLSLPSATFTNSGATFFIVAKPTTLTANAQILDLGGATVPDNLMEISENSSDAAQFSIYNSAGTSFTSVAAGTALSNTQFALIDVVEGDINSTTATLFINGSQAAQNASMNSVPAATLTSNFIAQYAGGGNYFPGQIAEMLVYNAPLTQSQRVAVEAYLMQRYQILEQVPTAPVISVAGGSLNGPTQVAIGAQPVSTIYYTLDGSTPTTSSPQYSGPINVYYSLTLKAIAVSNGLGSSVSSQTYTLNTTQWPAPASGGPSLQVDLTLPNTAVGQ
jgi:hypothetical protein